MKKILFIISTDDSETIYNAMRVADVTINKGDEVSVFMLGKGVLCEKGSSEQFNVTKQVNQFQGDFYVSGVCMKSDGPEGSSSCPIAWRMISMNRLLKLTRFSHSENKCNRHNERLSGRPAL
jgi:uncharacterized protein involved in oxidation of intracellular sulfur